MRTRNLDRRTFAGGAIAAGAPGAASAEQKSQPLKVIFGLNFLVYTAGANIVHRPVRRRLHMASHIFIRRRPRAQRIEVCAGMAKSA